MKIKINKHNPATPLIRGLQNCKPDTMYHCNATGDYVLVHGLPPIHLSNGGYWLHVSVIRDGNIRSVHGDGWKTRDFTKLEDGITIEISQGGAS
jgi:hypothetical protein